MRKSVSRSTTAQVVNFRPSEALLRTIRAWITHQHHKPSLSEAICRLVELGLALPPDQDGQTRRARKMAGNAIDRMGECEDASTGRPK